LLLGTVYRSETGTDLEGGVKFDGLRDQRLSVPLPRDVKISERSPDDAKQKRRPHRCRADAPAANQATPNRGPGFRKAPSKRLAPPRACRRAERGRNWHQMKLAAWQKPHRAAGDW
jgi:hypothetical protein